MTTSNYFQYLDMKTAREREGDVPSAIPRYGDSVRLSHNYEIIKETPPWGSSSPDPPGSSDPEVRRRLLATGSATGWERGVTATT